MRYWKGVSKRAWNGTAKLLGLDSASKIVFRFITFGIVALGIYFLIGQTAAHDAVIVRLLSALAICLIVPVAFIWKFVKTPAVLALEAEAVNNDLAKKVEKKIADQAVIDGIGNLRDRGNAIRSQYQRDRNVEVIKLARDRWVKDSVAYLIEHTEKSYADEFLAARATAMMGMPPGDPGGGRAYTDIQAKNAALTEIIRELRMRR